nr:tetrahydrofolate dehydrogenase/cyclohydrolase catalytic domain-containing protein [Tissierella sp.]
MAEILRGKDVADKIKEKMVKRIEKLNEKGLEPTLAIVRLGEDPSDLSYERGIINNSEKLGIKTVIKEEARDLKTEDLVKIIEELNNDDKISGILIFRPLPKQIDEELISKTISPDKDVDCMNPLNLAKIFEGDMSGFAPGTPKAAIEILLNNNIELEGKNIVVINRSLVVGKPLAMMLLEENATVTICHSRTKDLDKITRNADIVMTALGRAKMLDEKYFNEDSIIIDIGVSMDDEGKMSGDVDFENVEGKVAKITPVPRGVGSVTNTILLDNIVKACEKRA